MGTGWTVMPGARCRSLETRSSGCTAPPAPAGGRRWSATRVPTWRCGRRAARVRSAAPAPARARSSTSPMATGCSPVVSGSTAARSSWAAPSSPSRRARAPGRSCSSATSAPRCCAVRPPTLLGLKALDIYGLSEVIGPGVACECIEAHSTLPESPTDGVPCTLHVNEDHFLVEVIDSATGEPLPPRTYGELVFTTLTREAMPVLRYRTGDIAAIDPGPCVCGRTLIRMSKIVGRADDMLVIRGVNVYPSEVEAVLLAEPALGPQYLLVIDRTETMPSLIVVCELAGDVGGDDQRQRTRASIAVALERRLALRPEVHVLPPGTLPRTEVGKAQRVVDRTADHDPLQGLGT